MNLTRQAVGPTDVVADQATALRDEWRQGAHGGTLGAEGGELVAVLAEDLDLECGSGRVILGPARGQRFAVLGHGERSDGQEPEAIIVAQRGHTGPFREFQAHRDGWSGEARVEGLDPGIHRFRTMVKIQQLTSFAPSGLSAAIGCRISPVEANHGRNGFGGLWRHGCSPRVWDSGAKGQACVRSATA
jgi:hypothetical protein